jgi:hypothetical protein
MDTRAPRILLAAVTAAALFGGTGTALARHGADDPAGHDRRDDRVTRTDDDGARHHRGRHHRRHGADDGPNHS